MAESSAKCATQSQNDFNEDKSKGICRIKPEFIIDDHVRILSEEYLTNEDKEKVNRQVNLNGVIELTSSEPPEKKLKTDLKDVDTSRNQDNIVSSADKSSKQKRKHEDRREKLKGQNKSRPPPFKALRERSLCPWIVQQTVDEPEKKCPSAKCTFMHDRSEYLKVKQPDIGTECYVFNLTGKCPRGMACRFASKHITEDGLNIVDQVKFEEFQKAPVTTKNKISPALQDELRKRKYNFSNAQKVMKENESARSDQNNKTLSNGHAKPSVAESKESILCNKVDEEILNADTNHEPRLGSVPDHDLIKLRQSEKKKIDWTDKILLSPLTTVGNLPFRRICKEYGADITCGEMALAPKILKGTTEEWALVKRHECEDIFGVQLCGANAGVLTRCAQLLNEQAEIDFIDLNLGCPIDLIYQQGCGSGMLNRLGVLQTVVRSIAQVSSVPLTIKTRIGVKMDKPIAHNLMPKFREWGASMITVHGRSREQRYTKSADWAYIEQCAAAASPVPVFGNGDILCYDDYQTIRNQYPSVQGVTIGRGALIKPWIFKEIKEKKLFDISSSERLDILRKYSNYGLEHWGSDTRGVETTRRFMLEWISFLHRYIPVGILERPPQRINERPPYYKGRNDIETMMASSNCADWIKISEMFLGKVPEGFQFLPKHKANSWK